MGLSLGFEALFTAWVCGDVLVCVLLAVFAWWVME